MRRLSAILLLSLLSVGLAFATPATAKEAPQPGTAEASELPQKVRDFVSLMDDPQVRAWLAKQIAAPPAAAAPGGKASEEEDNGLDFLAGRFEKVHAHFAALAATLPTLPAQI